MFLLFATIPASMLQSFIGWYLFGPWSYIVTLPVALALGWYSNDIENLLRKAL